MGIPFLLLGLFSIEVESVQSEGEVDLGFIPMVTFSALLASDFSNAVFFSQK